MYFSTVAKCPMVPNSICKVISKVNFCQFDCDSGYSSMNSSMEREYTCDSNGDWQPHTPQCAQTDPEVAARGTTTTGVGSQSKSSSCRPISTLLLFIGWLNNAFISLVCSLFYCPSKELINFQSFSESSGTCVSFNRAYSSIQFWAGQFSLFCPNFSSKHVVTVLHRRHISLVCCWYKLQLP